MESEIVRYILVSNVVYRELRQLKIEVEQQRLLFAVPTHTIKVLTAMVLEEAMYSVARFIKGYVYQKRPLQVEVEQRRLLFVVLLNDLRKWTAALSTQLMQLVAGFINSYVQRRRPLKSEVEQQRLPFAVLLDDLEMLIAVVLRHLKEFLARFIISNVHQRQPLEVSSYNYLSTIYHLKKHRHRRIHEKTSASTQYSCFLAYVGD
ncbi:unnamed protein product [Anisakis simplex]|uniref:Histidine kinase n=1 Tax=Anisakis simplex TaxID=6269 RepID=A0A0M3JW82_ANISI|nr:unnamed protein product [Anisakis simplex]